MNEQKYIAWRVTYQSDEQAARAAFTKVEELASILERAYQLSMYAAAPFADKPCLRGIHPTTGEWWEGLKEEIVSTQHQIEEVLGDDLKRGAMCVKVG